MNKLVRIKDTLGLYRHTQSGVYYERIRDGGINTYVSLKLTNARASKTLIGMRRAARAQGKPMPVAIDGGGNSVYEATFSPAQPAANGTTAAAITEGKADL